MKKVTIPTGASGIQYSGDQLMSAYLYDNKYQLTSATFGTITSPGQLNKPYAGNAGGAAMAFAYQGPIFNALDDYKVAGITYDPNGNIKTLNRNGYTAHAGGLDMDQLTYGYSTTGGGRLLWNQLRYVTDAVTTSNSTLYNTFGFEPGQSATYNYVYDETGQQTEDNSAAAHGNLKSFTEYDVYGKVTAVYADAAKTTLRGAFTYDDRGYRVKKSDGTTDTWYIRDGSGNVMSTYEKPTSGGSIAQKELGLFGDKRLGIYDASAGTYLYELTDHLGNVRSTFASALQTTVTTKFDGTEADDYLFTYNTNIDYTENHSSPANKTHSVKLTPKSYGTGIFNTPVKAGQTVSGSYWYQVSGGTPDAMLVFALNNVTTNQLLNWQPKYVGSSGTWAEITFTYTVSANGMLSVYPWNNDASQTVWFDDLTLNFSGTGAGIAKAEAQSMADYYAHGSLMPGRNYFGSPAYRYGYQGAFAESDPETGKNSFELRNYDGLLGRWSTIDPYRQYHSPYMGMGNNPINFVDPNGGWDNPIYGIFGNLLGTDNLGLQGDAIIMDEKNFVQGMDHDLAMSFNLGFEGLSGNNAITTFTQSYINLPFRPDWDGYLTLAEANDWFRTGNGEPLFVSLDKLDLSGIHSEDFISVGSKETFNLLLNSNTLNDGLVYGNIVLKLYPNNFVRAYADVYDFDMKSWWNPLNWGRNVETIFGEKHAGQGTGYEINLVGPKWVSPVNPINK